MGAAFLVTWVADLVGGHTMETRFLVGKPFLGTAIECTLLFTAISPARRRRLR